MLNITLEQEQQQRVINAITAVEFELDRETELYHEGKFDGVTGIEPSHLEEQSYWDGYSLGQREYWAKKLEITISTEF